MRITEQMLIKNLVTNLERTRDRMSETQLQLSTGKKINTLSDDPLNVHKALRLRELKAINERFQENVGDSINVLSSLTEEVGVVADIVSKVKEFGMQASIPTADAEGRHSLAMLVDQMLEELVDQGNSTFVGRSIFGGVQTVESPYEIVRQGITDDVAVPEDVSVAGGTAEAPARRDQTLLLTNTMLVDGSAHVTDETGATTYVEGTDYTVDWKRGAIVIIGSGSIPGGSRIRVTYDTEGVGGVKERFPEDITGSIDRAIVEKTEMKINVSGREIFGSLQTPGKVDIFGLFRRLKNELERDNIEGIGATFDELDTALGQVTAVATEAGTELIRMTMLETRLGNENVALASRLSSIEDVDIAQAAVEFQADQAALQAALESGARMAQNSLIDFLK